MLAAAFWLTNFARELNLRIGTVLAAMTVIVSTKTSAISTPPLPTAKTSTE